MNPQFGACIIRQVVRSLLGIENLGEGASQDGLVIMNSIWDTLGLMSRVESSNQLSFVSGTEKSGLKIQIFDISTWT